MSSRIFFLIYLPFLPWQVWKVQQSLCVLCIFELCMNNEFFWNTSIRKLTNEGKRSSYNSWALDLVLTKPPGLERWKLTRAGSSLRLTDGFFCVSQLDQLVVDAAKEKRDMEQKHSTIQQKVHAHTTCRAAMFSLDLSTVWDSFFSDCVGTKPFTPCSGILNRQQHFMNASYSTFAV